MTPEEKQLFKELFGLAKILFGQQKIHSDLIERLIQRFAGSF